MVKLDEDKFGRISKKYLLANVVEISNLEKFYERNLIFRNFSLNVKTGSSTGLVGPNGAGKTTLFKCILGMTEIKSGSIRLYNYLTSFDGKIDRKLLDLVRKLIGFVPEDAVFYQHLSPREYLGMIASLLRIPVGIQKQRIDALIERFMLHRYADQMIATLSKGNRQKLNVASAFIHGPEFLLLDEPLADLDPGGRYHLTKILQEFHSGTLSEFLINKSGTILISSHLLGDIEKICTEVIVLNHIGELVLQGPISEVRDQLSDTASLEDVYMAVVEGIDDENEDLN